MINGEKEIIILNYSTTPQFCGEYTFERSEDGITPTITYVLYKDLRAFMGKPDTKLTFATGGLVIDDSEDLTADEIMKELHLHKDDILSDDDIKSILMNYTYENASKIVSIKNRAILDRFKAIMHLLLAQEESIPSKIVNIVNKRNDELQAGIITTKIQVVKNDTDKSAKRTQNSNSELDAMKAQNDALQKQVADMQTMMANLMAMMNGGTKTAETETKVEDAEKQVQKKAGRPPKK